MVEEIKKDAFTFDYNAVLVVLCLLYLSNILTRNHLKQILAKVKNLEGINIPKFLVEESQKGG